MQLHLSCGLGRFVAVLLAGGLVYTQTQAAAQRIITLAPNLSELAFAAGAGNKIVGTVAFSNFPAAARAIPLVGDAFRVDMERILALRPDLVLVWESGTPRSIVEQLQHLGLNVVSIDAHHLYEVRVALLKIGQLAGTEAFASQAADRFDRQMADLRKEYSSRTRVRVFIQVGDRPLYTVNGQHIVSEVVDLCGGDNVFKNLTQLAPVVGIEAVLAENPEAILATDDTVPDAKSTWAPWNQLTAVRAANVFTIPSDDFARTTLRLAQGAKVACMDLDQARQHLQTAK